MQSRHGSRLSPSFSQITLFYARHLLHVFPRFLPFTCFPRSPVGTCFPALSTGCKCFEYTFVLTQVDTYGTVQPHTLIRQHLDYNHWYDRAKLSLKEVHNCQYVACMNPTAGSFTINPRLQRHFAVFAISFPGLDALKTIYLSILNGHISATSLPQAVQKNSEKLVDAALAMNQKVRPFLPCPYRVLSI